MNKFILLSRQLTFSCLIILHLALPVIAQNLEDLPKQRDIIMLAGADYQLNIKNVTSTGAVVNITGYGYAAQFRSAPGGTLFATYSTRIINGPSGWSRVSLSRFQTLNLVGKTGVWDLLQTDTAGKSTFLATGKVVVQSTSTKLP
jgi:hypothetical protein